MDKIKMSDVFKSLLSYNENDSMGFIRIVENFDEDPLYWWQLTIKDYNPKDIDKLKAIAHAVNNHDQLQAENERLKEIIKELNCELSLSQPAKEGLTVNWKRAKQLYEKCKAIGGSDG